MADFIRTLHSYNVYLVILAGTVTAIWGLILFFTTKNMAPGMSTPDTKNVTVASTLDAKKVAVESESTPDTKDVPVASTSIPDTKDVTVASESFPDTKDVTVASTSIADSNFTARTRPWRRVLTITVVLALLQGLLGVTMVIMGLRPGPAGDSLYYLHFVYGGIVALVIPVATTYATGGKNPRRDLLVYSLAALILTAAAVRAWMTGPDVFSLLP